MKNNNTAFTMGELLIAVAILALVLVGMLQLFLQCMYLTDLAKNKTIAESIAQSKLEEIWNAEYDTIVDIFTPSCPCSDGVDNDADGSVDHPADAGCSSLSTVHDTREDYECADGIDNDGNGLVDFPADPGCASATDDDEGYLPEVAHGACTGTFAVTEINSKTSSGAISIDASHYDIMGIQVTVNWTNRDNRTSNVVVSSYLSRE